MFASEGKSGILRLPILPLRDIVVFPYMVVPLFVGRERSIRALDFLSVKDDSRQVLLVAQKNATNDNPEEADLYQMGVAATVLQLLKLPDGTVKVLVEGTHRCRIQRFLQKDPCFLVEAVALPEQPYEKITAMALMHSVIGQFEEYAKLGRKLPVEVLSSLQGLDDPEKLADTAAAHLNLSVAEKQEILELEVVTERLERIFVALEQEIEVIQVEKRIRGRVKRQMEKSHRDYYLNEQMKAIQKELGEREEDFRDELNELAERIAGAGMPVAVRKKADSELKKLRQTAPMSAEATVVRNYLDWLSCLPWNRRTRLKHDIRQAEIILDEDHYGLEKVKERIVEHLAVQLKVGKMKGPILCLVGPPGVGKTSLAKSIARASGRKYVRISLGGVRDEAEIRGHRRTYIGSMPGKIIQAMKKANSKNPLILLDEIDKVGSDSRGDPASALLEVLDPEQNCAFNDHYLEVDYDLSSVMFITTANSLNISRPLLDRMEVIRLAGYTEDEKFHIARRYLVQRQMTANGLKQGEFSLSDAVVLDLIRYYTREAGVRNLEREIATLCRKATRELLLDESRKSVAVGVSSLGKFLGVRRYRFDSAEENDLIGVATGLAWTEVGGELLSIEVMQLAGTGKITITGKLGEVMQESAQAALTYARSRSEAWGLTDQEYFQKKDFHIHVPEGATPKDGPSAGIALCTSIISLLTGISVRRDVAMTGEITLRGRVLVIGGLKEKLLAAHRARIRKVLIPLENVKDLKDFPASVLRELEIQPVSHMDEVLTHALTAEPATVLKDANLEGIMAGSLALANELLPAGKPPAVTH